MQNYLRLRYAEIKQTEPDSQPQTIRKRSLSLHTRLIFALKFVPRSGKFLRNNVTSLNHIV